jgi:hypothetical protein
MGLLGACAFALGCEPETGTDASVNADAGSGTDASIADAAQPGHSRSGEVRWNVNEGEVSDYCPHQSIALWKDETITLHDSASPGFQCYDSPGSCRPPPDFDARFLLVTDEIELFLIFRARVLLGYSVESFRENLLRAQLHWRTTSKTSIGSGVVELSTFEPPTLEIVSYQAPILHVRMQALSVWMTNSFDEQATVPYPCISQGPTGPIPYLCTHVDCRYSTEATANGVHLTLDLKLPIEQPAP